MARAKSAAPNSPIPRNNTSIPGNMHFRDKELVHQQDIVNAFADFFSSVFTSDIPCDNSTFEKSKVLYQKAYDELMSLLHVAPESDRKLF
ncbi:hypothetical protein Zmor_003753 [Zophobas morio]|uniref:Uncharacterized protein n=1 Tax=Zophobas morio TaxID=2755281 RepID=A0AA38HN94_9CUCU|nr:hypothetical protein Zmor_003753 [Zophobas morio]